MGIFDATNLGPTLGGTPLAILSLFGDTPRALAASPDGGTVYAAVFHSGNQTTTVSEGLVCNGGAPAGPCAVGGFTMPGGLPAPNVDRNGVPQPEVGLIVKWNAAAGRWQDELGRSWNDAVRFSLPDLDVFAIDANAATPAQTAAFPYVGTVLEADTFVPSAASHIAVSGGGPSGLVLDEARGRLYALTRFDNAVSVIDTVSATEVAHLPVYDPEPAAVKAGRPVLYDAVLTSSNGEASCAACHVFADLDSLGWDLGNPDDEVLNNPNPSRVPNQFGLSFPDHHPTEGPDENAEPARHGQPGADALARRPYRRQRSGSTDTLFRFHQATVFNRTNPAGFPLSNPDGFPSGAGGEVQRRQMEQFMLAFDSNLAPIVGQQATLTDANAAVAGPRLDLLVARAAAGECDVVVRGTVAGEQRGAVRLASGSFRSDRAREPLRTDAEMRALAATPGQDLTWTCVPPGEGTRIGVDCDQDAAFDRDELDAGTDPADPASVPGVPAFTLVGTTSLILKDRSAPPANPAKRKLAFRSATKPDAPANRVVPPAPQSPADPTIHYATVIVYNALGVTADAMEVALPAAGWTARRGGYRYKDPDGPITSVVMKPDLLVVKGGKAGWGYPLDEPQQIRVAVRVALASGGFCAEAPAKTKGTPPSTAASDRVDKFVARKRAPASAACPPLAGGSPSGAFVQAGG